MDRIKKEIIKYESRGEEDTARFAKWLGGILKAGDIVLLKGELGSGKTHFVQGLARGLGIEENITSPTYTLINEYRGRIPLYHMDFYRLDDSDDLYNIGFEEYLSGQGVVAIEWPEIASVFIPPYHVEVEIKVLSVNNREIKLTAGEKILKGMSDYVNTGD